MNRNHWIMLAAMALTVIIGGAGLAALHARTSAPSGMRIQAVLATALDESFNPVAVTEGYRPRDAFYLSARVEGVPPRSIVSVRWHFGNALISAQDQATGLRDEPHVLGFTLRRSDADWPEGSYRAEILLAGELVGTLSFAVSADG